MFLHLGQRMEKKCIDFVIADIILFSFNENEKYFFFRSIRYRSVHTTIIVVWFIWRLRSTKPINDQNAPLGRKHQAARGFFIRHRLIDVLMTFSIFLFCFLVLLRFSIYFIFIFRSISNRVNKMRKLSWMRELLCSIRRSLRCIEKMNEIEEQKKNEAKTHIERSIVFVVIVVVCKSNWIEMIHKNRVTNQIQWRKCKR